MKRVLVTGGAGTIGSAVVRRLVGDPEYSVRVADQRPIPDWMRDAAEVHQGDLRTAGDAALATAGCTDVSPSKYLPRSSAVACSARITTTASRRPGLSQAARR